MSQQDRIKVTGIALMTVFFCIGGASRVLYLQYGVEWAQGIAPFAAGSTLLTFLGMVVLLRKSLFKKIPDDGILTRILQIIVSLFVVAVVLSLLYMGLRFYFP